MARYWMPVPWRWKMDYEFKARLGYTVRPYFKKRRRE